MKLRSFVLGSVVASSLILTTVYLKKHQPRVFSFRSPAADLPPSPLPSNSPISICDHAYQAVCQNSGEVRDPTGGVTSDADGEKQALQIYEDLIQKHPEWTSEQVDEELVRVIYTPKRTDRIRSAFNWVAHAIDEFIDRQPQHIFTPREKKQLRQRLRKIQLELPPPASNYSDALDLFTKNDVYYERLMDGRMRLRVGGAYLLMAKSWFNIIFTFAHELAHGIDPCEVRSARLSFPAYDRLSACFLERGLIAARKTRSECGQNDQLSETFADWIAVRMTARALKTFSTEFRGSQLTHAAINAVKDLCEQPEDLFKADTEYHPAPHLRIRIFVHNPEIRGILGCSAIPPEYCNFESSLQENPMER